MKNTAAATSPTAETTGAASPERFASAVPSFKVTPGKIVNETGGYTLAKTGFYNDDTSGNWSGYTTPVSSGTYDEAQTEFKVPAVSCAKDPNSAVSFWPGIDGVGDQTVEQLGITGECDGTTPEYFGWVEEYPNPAYAIGNGNTPAPVAPGDDITASVADEGSGTTYDFSLVDVTQGWEYQGTMTMPNGITADDSTAEVIAEAPTDANTLYQIPLANFGSVDFTGSEYNTSTSFSSANSTAIDMADNGEQLASTGTVTSGDFDVAYKNSDASTPPTGVKASTDNISVGWKAVAGATKYEVKIDGPNLDKDGTVNADQTHAIYYDIAGGTYKYQVRAINASGDSPWTAVKSVVFTNATNSAEQNSTATDNSTAAVSDSAATGVPTTPTGLTASTDNISIGWTAVPNAQSYQVYIDGPNLNKTGTVNADQTHAIYYDIAKGTFKYELRSFNVTGYSPWTAFKSVVFNR